MDLRYLATGRYKEHFACFRCRKCYKQPPLSDLPETERPLPGQVRVVLCPQCRAPMVDVGKDFEAPRRSAVKQWKLAEKLYEHGIPLAGGQTLNAAELSDMDTLLENRGAFTEGQRLLRKIDKRRNRRPRG